MIPNPGSDEALDRGCKCAVLDNCHGRTDIYGNNKNWEEGGAFWITESCPVHCMHD